MRRTRGSGHWRGSWRLLGVENGLFGSEEEGHGLTVDGERGLGKGIGRSFGGGRIPFQIPLFWIK